MKTKHPTITITCKTPPVVELDSAAGAAYVRFSRHKVARTQVLDSTKATVTVDFDAAGDAIGIELIGVEEFTLARLLESCGIKLQPDNPDAIGRARYIRTGAKVPA
jgi:uncharacterized protein YuzE